MYDALKAVLPNMTFLSLDPLHLVFVYEQAHWKKQTPGSCFLRSVPGRWPYSVDARVEFQESKLTAVVYNVMCSSL
eukprot:3395560-Amphidinium_carterae.1